MALQENQQQTLVSQVLRSRLHQFLKYEKFILAYLSCSHYGHQFRRAVMNITHLSTFDASFSTTKSCNSFQILLKLFPIYPVLSFLGFVRDLTLQATSNNLTFES